MSKDTEWDEGFKAAQKYYSEEISSFERELLAMNSQISARFRVIEAKLNDLEQYMVRK